VFVQQTAASEEAEHEEDEEEEEDEEVTDTADVEIQNQGQRSIGVTQSGPGHGNLRVSTPAALQDTMQARQRRAGGGAF